MSTTEWSVRIGRDFEADVASLKKSHYRKNRHAAQELDRFLDSLQSALAFNPLASHLERPKAKLTTKPYPTGHAVEGAMFRTARFRMPDLRGDAKHGRVYFDVHSRSRSVRLLGAYTHAEHAPDLSERLLIRRVKQEPLF